MEEINRAYNLLMKEGMYEQLHVSRLGAAHSGMPRTPDEFDKWSEHARDGIASDEIGLLDPDTERQTPDGRFMYQHRNTAEWHIVDRPIARPDKPRYQSFGDTTIAAKYRADLQEEIRNMSDTAAREDGEEKDLRRSSSYRQFLKNNEDSIPVKMRGPMAFFFFMGLFALCCYLVINRGLNKRRVFEGRREYWNEIKQHKQYTDAMYKEFKPELDVCGAAAALVFLAAARKVAPDAPLVKATPSDLTSRPPAFFHLMWNTN